jgi:hypothetical protein
MHLRKPRNGAQSVRTMLTVDPQFNTRTHALTRTAPGISPALLGQLRR